MPITRWYVEQPDKRIELEVNYLPDRQLFVIEGHVSIYHTNEDGTRGTLRCRIAFDGSEPGIDGSDQGSESGSSGGSSGGSAGSDTDAVSSEVARATGSVPRPPGSGPRVRREYRWVVRPTNQEE